MEIKTLRKLIEKPEFLNKELAFYQRKKIIQKTSVDIDEIKDILKNQSIIYNLF